MRHSRKDDRDLRQPHLSSLSDIHTTTVRNSFAARARLGGHPVLGPRVRGEIRS